MKKQSTFYVFVSVLILGMVVAACSPTAAMPEPAAAPAIIHPADAPANDSMGAAPVVDSSEDAASSFGGTVATDGSQSADDTQLVDDSSVGAGAELAPQVVNGRNTAVLGQTSATLTGSHTRSSMLSNANANDENSNDDDSNSNDDNSDNENEDNDSNDDHGNDNDNHGDDGQNNNDDVSQNDNGNGD